MDRIKLSQILYRWNPWWEGKKPVMPEFKRSEYFHIQKEISNKKISVITGPRQTGKTTLMYQLIAGIIDGGTKPSQVLYLLLDDFIDEIEKGNLTLREILEVWSEDILKERLTEGKKIVFFDEIQVYKKWSRELKSLISQNYPIKFIASGSSSVDILERTSESLAGRISRTIIMPLKFNEILRFYVNNDIWTEKIKPLTVSLTKCLLKGLSENKPDIFFREMSKAYKALLPIEDIIRIHFNKYFKKGGYPEIALQDLDRFQSFSRLKNYIDSVIHKDFVNFFKVRDTKTLERILKLVSKNTSQIIVERGLAKDLGASVNTIRNHLGFLESAFLVMGSSIHSKSYAKKIRRPEKLYIIDIGLGDVLAGYDDSDNGKIAETIVHNHLEFIALSNPIFQFELTYWKNNREIDIILTHKSKSLPIEVKYGKARNIEAVKDFTEKYNTWGIVISDELKQEGRIIFVPIHLILLLQ
ncbi:MAG: ATP-binding protein [Candidatus Omnitrophica bacterium]|nr:ATP-binding protein [Candidatus Omnitrophota bacterium]